MVFHWSLSDSKSPQVSRTLLSILTDFSNVFVSIVSICPLISKSSSSCTKPLVTIPSVPITIGITIIFMFHDFCSLLLSFLLLLYFLVVFSHQCQLMIPHRRLSDSKSPQISRTLLATPNNAVVWMVLICPLTFNSSSHPPSPLWLLQVCQLQLVSQLLSCSTSF